MSMIKLNNVSKFYRNKNTISTGFTRLNLELDMGEFVVITGESGSGKSTLLNVISGLDSYEEGEMYICGEETSHYTEVDYENYRRKYIGNIFQHFNLVNSYTVYQNIELVLLLNGYKRKEVKQKVLDIIKTVGLTRYKNTKASKLSGGQKQRVAIARALAKDTPLIVADEPTGNLDVASAKSIMKLLHDISKEKLVVIVTHNYEQVEEYATRKISMHDGKIIEDKKLKEHTPIEPETVKYKDLTKMNKLLLGFRNAFNIKTKFILLMLVYIVLTFTVFAEYTSLRKMDYDRSSYGYNYLFQNTSDERIILNKKDKSSFTEEELNKLKDTQNINKVVKDDLLLDLSADVYNQNVYFYGSVLNLDMIDEVDEGRMPKNENEIVIEGSKDSYYFTFYKDNIIGEEMSLNANGNSIDSKVEIVGIRYRETDNFSSVFYMGDKLINEIRKGLNVFYSTTTLKINNNIFSSSDYRIYYKIASNKNVLKGDVYTTQELDYYCKNYSCANSILQLEVENLYYKDSLDLKVKKSITKDNIDSILGLKNYSDYANTIFISEEDYNDLFMKDTYQISVFMDNPKTSEETLKSLKDKGYNAFYIKNNLVNEMNELYGIVKIIRSVVFIVATIALFFISYFIIKIILKSRNVYFSTIRILGATKKIAKQLLNIELLVDINLAYLMFLGVVFLVKTGVTDIAYISDMITFFSLFDYIAVYVILTAMSLLISNRYAHKLFKDSVMSTYREEV